MRCVYIICSVISVFSPMVNTASVSDKLVFRHQTLKIRNVCSWMDDYSDWIVN